MRLLIILSLFIACLTHVRASAGDNTPYFKKCWEDCAKYNCTQDGVNYKLGKTSPQPTINKLFLWECRDECQYECMWKTVELMEERNWKIPQFFGKWPFVRVWGIQEFGSVLGSFLNLFAHIINYQHLKNVVPSRHSTFWLWKLFFMVCTNAWIWSIIFHTRDTPFTEFMDYCCAFSMVLMVFYSFGMRVLPERHRMFRTIFTCLCLSYFANHAFYLYYNKIDYTYNMIANIIVGVLGGLGWLLWSLYYLYKGRTYVWRCLLFVVLTASSMLLELNDFPPIMKMWDAHAIWHLSTCPLPFLLYRFMIDDCKYLRKHVE